MITPEQYYSNQVEYWNKVLAALEADSSIEYKYLSAVGTKPVKRETMFQVLGQYAVTVNGVRFIFHLEYLSQGLILINVGRSKLDGNRCAWFPANANRFLIVDYLKCWSNANIPPVP